MKIVASVHAILSLVVYVICFKLVSAQCANSFLIGALVIQINFLILGISWGMIFKKKLVALAGTIIIFKYAILGAIIYQLVKQQWLNLLWFAMGVASFIFAAITYAVIAASKKET